MKFYSQAEALQAAIELSKINLESTNDWIHPEEVTYFIKEVASFLSSDLDLRIEEE